MNKCLFKSQHPVTNFSDILLTQTRWKFSICLPNIYLPGITVVSICYYNVIVFYKNPSLAQVLLMNTIILNYSALTSIHMCMSVSHTGCCWLFT